MQSPFFYVARLRLLWLVAAPSPCVWVFPFDKAWGESKSASATPQRRPRVPVGGVFLTAAVVTTCDSTSTWQERVLVHLHLILPLFSTSMYTKHPRQPFMYRMMLGWRIYFFTKSLAHTWVKLAECVGTHTAKSSLIIHHQKKGKKWKPSYSVFRRLIISFFIIRQKNESKSVTKNKKENVNFWIVVSCIALIRIIIRHLVWDFNDCGTRVPCVLGRWID